MLYLLFVECDVYFKKNKKQNCFHIPYFDAAFMLPLQFASIRAQKTSFETFVFNSLARLGRTIIDGHRYDSINALVYETNALATEAEAKTKAFSVEAEARSRRLKFQLRRDRAEALLRLETVSRRQDRGHIPDA